MHPVWLESAQHHRLDTTPIPKENMLRPFADFLDEFDSFSANRVNIHALKVVIEGQKTESVLVWEMMKHAASLQEALA